MTCDIFRDVTLFGGLGHMFRNIEKILRICKRCDPSSIDDEIHMLLYCRKFSQEREHIASKFCKLDFSLSKQNGKVAQ